MQVRPAYRRHRRRVPLPPWSPCLAGMVLVSALALTACGHGGVSTSHPRRCGIGRTAASVPVIISVNSSQVSCGTAMSVEVAYAKAVIAGKAPGNGGGGPVAVDGWTCSGFPTPVVLRTGNAFKCVKHDMEILATLRTQQTS
jgi:hypothetical protein